VLFINKIFKNIKKHWEGKSLKKCVAHKLI